MVSFKLLVQAFKTQKTGLFFSFSLLFFYDVYVMVKQQFINLFTFFAQLSCMYVKNVLLLSCLTPCEHVKHGFIFSFLHCMPSSYIMCNS